MTNAKRSSLVSILVFAFLLPAIFAIAPQTAFGITLLHEFEGGADDGRNPRGSLTLSGSTLYGTTRWGGYSNKGVVFRMNADGTGYTLLHEFAGGVWGEGSYPSYYGSLTLSGSILYGMTELGGDYQGGVVFRVNTDGTGYGLLHEFAGGANDGSLPIGSLTLSGSTLYGVTREGGDNDYGVIFEMNTDGSGHTLLHEFAGGADDGAWAYGSLILSGSTLYGMAREGGDDDYGVVFSLTIPEPSTLLLLAPALLGLGGVVLKRRR